MTIDTLDPACVDEMLKVLKANGVSHARITKDGLDVTFEADFAAHPLPGLEPQPGAWKSESPARLDHPSQFDYPANEVP